VQRGEFVRECRILRHMPSREQQQKCVELQLLPDARYRVHVLVDGKRSSPNVASPSDRRVPFSNGYTTRAESVSKALSKALSKA
jgi:hypothetical protein